MSGEVFTEEMKEEFYRLYKYENLSFAKIAEKFKVSRGRVRYWIRQKDPTIKRIENKALIKEKCKTCMYGDYRGYCNYLLVTDERRPCPVSLECSCYKAGAHKVRGVDPLDNHLKGTCKVDSLYTQAYLTDNEVVNGTTESVFDRTIQRNCTYETDDT